MRYRIMSMDWLGDPFHPWTEAGSNLIEKEDAVIEVHISYDLLPNSDPAAYSEWQRKAIIPVMKCKGFVELRAHRNLLGSPHILLITAWETLSDWASFAESGDWVKLVEELGASLATHIHIQIWGPSPVVPESLRPPINTK
jgi:antibiotic biosynthesis monooxygenase (ABM) superfamily enzyme